MSVPWDPAHITQLTEGAPGVRQGLGSELTVKGEQGRDANRGGWEQPGADIQEPVASVLLWSQEQ